MYRPVYYNASVIFSGGQNPNGPAPIPKGPTNQPPPTPPAAPMTAPQKNVAKIVKHDQDESTIPTPYPNKGIILQSLNYIQMDVFSSVFPNNKNDTDIKETKEIDKKQTFSKKRETAFVTEALFNIENNLRSLF